MGFQDLELSAAAFEQSCLNDRIATLGKDGLFTTCSADVGRRMFPHCELVLKASFEEAAKAMMAGYAEKLLIPGAYPQIAKFFMSDELVLETTFQMTIPPLGLVTPADLGERIDLLYYHPATTSLLPKIEYEVVETETVSSNEVAVERMKEAGGSAAAVTNGLVAAVHQMKFTQILRPAKPMSWSVFRRA